MQVESNLFLFTVKFSTIVGCTFPLAESNPSVNRFEMGKIRLIHDSSPVHALSLSHPLIEIIQLKVIYFVKCSLDTSNIRAVISNNFNCIAITICITKLVNNLFFGVVQITIVSIVFYASFFSPFLANRLILKEILKSQYFLKFSLLIFV